MLSGIRKSATTEKLRVISINYGESRCTFKKITEALANSPVEPVSDIHRKTGKKYGVDGIPYMLIIDAEGKVASVQIGYGESQLSALIEEVNEVASRGGAD